MTKNHLRVTASSELPGVAIVPWPVAAYGQRKSIPTTANKLSAEVTAAGTPRPVEVTTRPGSVHRAGFPHLPTSSPRQERAGKKCRWRRGAKP